MKRLIALLLVFSMVFSLVGCSIDTDEITDAIKDEISREVDEAIDKTKEEVSNKVNEAVDDAKTEVSQKVEEAVDGVKTEVGQITGDLPNLDDVAIELPKTEKVEQSWVENLAGGIDNFLGRDLTVTYLSNGGTGGPEEQRFKGNTHVLIADEKPIKSGYHFVGWTRIEGSDEPMYFAGEWAGQPFTQDTALYACWEKYNPDEPFAVKACKGQTLNYGGVFELIGGSAGVKDIIIEHKLHLVKENSGKTIRIKCDCGFELVDRNISLDNFVIIKSEGEYLGYDALDASKKDEYRKDYALFCQQENGMPKTGEEQKDTSGKCDHTPNRYEKRSNTILCKCRSKRYYNYELYDLDYNTFSTFISFWDTLLVKNKDEYCTKAYLKFLGVNPVFFELLEELDLGSDYKAALEKITNLTKTLEKMNLGKTLMVNYAGGLSTVEAVQKFDDVFSKSITVVNGLVNFQVMIDSKEDPFEACKAFIDLVKIPIGMLTGVTGGANTFLLVGLDAIKIDIDAIRAANKLHLRQLEYTWLGYNPCDGALIHQWSDIEYGEAFWKENITYAHILGSEKKTGLKLPSLPEIVEEYDRLSEDGKKYALEYILFCLEYSFEECLGIGYAEYIDFLGKKE